MGLLTLGFSERAAGRKEHSSRYKPPGCSMPLRIVRQAPARGPRSVSDVEERCFHTAAVVGTRSKEEVSWIALCNVR